MDYLKQLFISTVSEIMDYFSNLSTTKVSKIMEHLTYLRLGHHGVVSVAERRIVQPLFGLAVTLNKVTKFIYFCENI